MCATCPRDLGADCPIVSALPAPVRVQSDGGVLDSSAAYELLSFLAERAGALVRQRLVLRGEAGAGRGRQGPKPHFPAALAARCKTAHTHTHSVLYIHMDWIVLLPARLAGRRRRRPAHGFVHVQ